MNWDEYKEEVLNDAKQAINENFDAEESFENVYDELFVDDSVTGNASGSYYFNSAKAAEAVSGIIFDEEAVEYFRDYGYEGIPTEKGAETCDVIARCIALGQVYGELEEYYNELVESAEEATDEEE